MRPWIRRNARRVLSLLLLLSVIGWAVSARDFLKIPLIGQTAGWASAVIRAELTRATHATVTPEWLETEMTEALAAEPRDWLRIDLIKELATDNGIALTPTTRDAHNRAYAEDNGWFSTAGNCFWCALNRANCKLDATLLCGMAIDVTSIGDGQTLVTAGIAYWSGREVNYFDVSLAGAGIASTVLLQPQIKLGAGMVKTARAARSLSAPLEASLVTLARSSVHADRLPRRIRDLSPTAIKKIIDPAALKTLGGLTEDIGAISEKLPDNHTLHMLRQIDSPAEARSLRRATDAMGEKTPATLQALGKPRVIKALARPLKLAMEMLAATVALLAAFWLVIGHILQTALTWALRRLAR